MKKLIYILLFLLLHSWAWGADTWIEDIGEATPYYSTSNQCGAITTGDTSGDIQAAYDSLISGDTLTICAGTYSGTEIDSADGLDIDGSNNTIQGHGAVTIDNSTDVCSGSYSNWCMVTFLVNGASNITIKDINFIGSNDDAIYVRLSTGVSITNCTFSGNGVGSGGDRDTIGWYQATGTISGVNITHAGDMNPITATADDDSNVLTIQNSYIARTADNSGTAGISLKRGVFYLYNNVIKGSSSLRGIYFICSEFKITLEAYNNTIYDFDFNLLGSFDGTAHASTLLTFKNNISDNPDIDHINFLDADGLNYYVGDYNAYNPDSASAFKIYLGADYTLAQWQTATSDEASSIAADPLLNGDYTLQPNSPAIDAGELLSIHVDGWRDLYGWEHIFGTAPDIGAYEYRTTDWSPHFADPLKKQPIIADWYTP
jgi:hypothetical protein